MYDVIVVGARVAGASTAMLLARKGLKVLLLDKATFPSDTISTLMIQPRGVAYLYRWGLAKNLKRITPLIKTLCVTRENISIASIPSSYEFRKNLHKDHGWSGCEDGTEIPLEWMMVRRKILDYTLINAAVESGVEFKENHKVHSVFFHNNRYKSISGITLQGITFSFQSSFLVIADGRNSVLMKQVEAKTLKQHYNAEFCYYNFYAGLDSSLLKFPVHKKGRYAIAYGPTNNNLHLVSIWGPTAYASKFFQNPEVNFQKVIHFCYPELAEALRNSIAVEQPKRMYNVPNVMREVIGPGWLAIGDAACALSQTTAVGITNAFRDAELAAYYIYNTSRLGTEIAMQEYSKKHFDDLDNYFSYVCESSECRVPTKKEILILEALRNNPTQAGRFIAVRSRLAPVSYFYNKDNIESLLSAVDSSIIKNSHLMQNFSTIIDEYQNRQPWEISF